MNQRLVGPKAPVSFPRKEVVARPETLWVLGRGRQSWPSTTPPAPGTGAARLGPGDCPGHPPRCGSASWPLFLSAGPDSGTLGPFSASANK